MLLPFAREAKTVPTASVEFPVSLFEIDCYDTALRLPILMPAALFGAITADLSVPVAWFSPMSRYSSRLFVACVYSLSLSGCAYDRSFMQMDSNSGVPFFGLQWAVDSGSRPSFQNDTSVLKLTAPESALSVPDPRAARQKADKSDALPQVVTVSRQSH